MPLLDPQVKYEPIYGPYKLVLERLSNLLEKGNLEDLPQPKDPLPGPIIFIESILPERIKARQYFYLSPHGKTLYVSRGDPFKDLDLRAEFITFLLHEIFDKDDAKYHRILDEKLFPYP